MYLFNNQSLDNSNIFGGKSEFELQKLDYISSPSLALSLLLLCTIFTLCSSLFNSTKYVSTQLSYNFQFLFY